MRVETGLLSAFSTVLAGESDGYFTPVRQSLMFGWKSLEQFVDRLLGQNQSLVFLLRVKFLHDRSLPDHLASIDELQGEAPLGRPAAHLRVLRIPPAT